MNIDKKCTVYCSFTGGMPRKFCLYNSKGELYYKRFLDGKTPRIKFNVLHADNYTGNVPFKIVKITGVELPDKLPDLPPYSRNRVKDITITYNKDLEGTPARIYTDKGIIERGKRFFSFSKPVRVFFLLHEVGHFYYGINKNDLEIANGMSEENGRAYLKKKVQEGEQNCDLFALVHFLRMGFNRSTAFQALKEVLKRSPENIKRINVLMNNIKQTQDATNKAA
jgi:hypothetical protein